MPNWPGKQTATKTKLKQRPKDKVVEIWWGERLIGTVTGSNGEPAIQIQTGAPMSVLKDKRTTTIIFLA